MTTYLNYNTLNIYTSTASDMLVDYVWVKRGHPTTEEVTTINNFYFKPQRDDNTLLLANFDSTLNGGDIQNINSPILNWNIYKREDNSPILKYVVSLPVDQNSFIDYNVKYGHNYQYEIFAETATTLSLPFTNPELMTAFWHGWMLIDLPEPTNGNLYIIDKSDVWMFETNFSSDELIQNIDKYTYENFTQFPKVSTGRKNYISGGITAFLSNVTTTNTRYSDSSQMMNAFSEVIANGNLKLLKDRKGNAWIIDTQENGFKYVDESVEQIVTVGFNFIQLDSSDNYTVVSEGMRIENEINEERGINNV